MLLAHTTDASCQRQAPRQRHGAGAGQSDLGGAPTARLLTISLLLTLIFEPQNAKLSALDAKLAGLVGGSSAGGDAAGGGAAGGGAAGGGLGAMAGKLGGLFGKK